MRVASFWLRSNFLVLFGLIGVALTLASAILGSGLFDIAHLLRAVLDLWSSAIYAVWRLLFGWLRVEIFTWQLMALQFVVFVIVMALGIRLKMALSAPSDRETAPPDYAPTRLWRTVVATLAAVALPYAALEIGAGITDALGLIAFGAVVLLVCNICLFTWTAVPDAFAERRIRAAVAIVAATLPIAIVAVTLIPLDSLDPVIPPLIYVLLLVLIGSGCLFLWVNGSSILVLQLFGLAVLYSACLFVAKIVGEVEETLGVETVSGDAPGGVWDEGAGFIATLLLAPAVVVLVFSIALKIAPQEGLRNRLALSLALTLGLVMLNSVVVAACSRDYFAWAGARVVSEVCRFDQPSDREQKRLEEAEIEFYGRSRAAELAKKRAAAASGAATEAPISSSMPTAGWMLLSAGLSPSAILGNVASVRIGRSDGSLSALKVVARHRATVFTEVRVVYADQLEQVVLSKKTRLSAGSSLTFDLKGRNVREIRYQSNSVLLDIQGNAQSAAVIEFWGRQ